MTRFRAAVVAFASLLATSHALAGPDGTAKYLMNEPASMMDLGIERLKSIVTFKNVFGAEYGKTRAGIGINYDWDENKVVIDLFPDQQFQDAAAFDAYARSHIGIVRALLWVNPDTGRVDAKGANGASLVATFFTHAGYTRKNTPKDLDKEIDKLILVRVRGVAGSKSPTHTELPISCQGQLVETQVLCDR